MAGIGLHNGAESGSAGCGPAIRNLLAGRLLPSRAGLSDRLLAGAIAAAAWGVLALAVTLTPRPEGFGTHQQLGLSACSSMVTGGLPCPSCGMTTAFAWFVHGHLGAALRAHVFGTVLAIVTLLTALGGSAMAATGVHLGLVLRWMFIGRTGWIYALCGLAAGSWALKALIG